MTSTKYIGMDVHKESISSAVMNASGKIVMECVIETKASMILQFIDGLRGDVHVTFEEGTSAAWLYDLLKPHVTKLVVCDPRKNASMREGNQNDKIDARRLAELLRLNHRCEKNEKTQPRSQPGTWRGTSEQISLHQVGCEARKRPAGAGVFFLDFSLYRTSPFIELIGFFYLSDLTVGKNNRHL